MAVAIDNTGQSGIASAASSATITSFAVGAGANRFIWLGVSQYSSTDRVPSAVFNTSESFIVHDATTIAESPGTRRVTILKLVAPSNVTANIVVSWSGAVDEIVIGGTSWTGVDQTTPLGTAVKNSGTSGTSTSVTVSSASGGAVHDSFAGDAGASPAVTANQTQRWRTISAAGNTEGAGQSAAGTGSNIACTWTNAGGLNTFCHIGAAINAAGGGGGRTFFLTPGLDGLSTSGPKQFNPSLGYHRTPAISLEAYRREQARKHREFMATVARRSA